MHKIAIIHTTPVTIYLLGELVNDIIPECKIVNLLDDSILPQLIENDGDINTVNDRLMAYISIAEDLDVDLVLSACSSVGEVFEMADKELEIPVTRIDEAMAEIAVGRGNKIGVAATLKTTLAPTLRLLEKKAEKANKYINFETALISTAFEKLTAGDQKEHDRLLLEGLKDLVNEVDCVVLAQASMARVVSELSHNQQKKFLTSPESGIKRVKSILKED